MFKLSLLIITTSCLIASCSSPTTPQSVVPQGDSTGQHSTTVTDAPSTTTPTVSSGGISVGQQTQGTTTEPN